MNLDLKLARGDVKKIVLRLWKHQATFALHLKNIFIWPNFSVYFSLITYFFLFYIVIFSIINNLLFFILYCHFFETHVNSSILPSILFI